MSKKSSINKIIPTVICQDKFDYIVHISDLHIRPQERHDEYKHVFSKLYETITSLKDKKLKIVIVITGDIFDNKVRFLPSQYDLCNNFFTTLCQIYPLIIICGNHDMKDAKQIDSITPSAYKRDNFYYLKESGAYEYGDIVFSVSSLYDSESRFIKRNEINTTKKCIALYHGTLDSASNDDGYTFKSNITNRFRSKKEFNGYDYVLLGDIHKMQSLRTTMWYSGSLIQQNFGETLNKHGFLLWDLIKAQVTFHEITNDYGLVTIIMKDGIWTNNDISFPKKSTIRVIICDTINSKVEETLKVVESMTTILNVHVIDESTTICNNDIVNNTKHEDVLLSELKIHETSEKILDIHTEYMKNIPNLLPKGIGYLWYPETLKYKNLFGYNNNHEHVINFSTGVTSITAPNAVGKTSIINILLYGLFDNLLYKGSKNIDVLNNNEKEGELMIIVKHGVTEYTIVKKLVRQVNNVLVHTELSYQEELVVTLHDKDAIVKLTELFGHIDDFHKCNILNSRDQGNDFFYLTPTTKVKYLKDIFKFDYFDELVVMNKKKVESVQNKLNIKQGEHNILMSNISGIDLVNIQNQINSINKVQVTLSDDMVSISDKLVSMNKDVAIKETQISPISVSMKSIVSLISKIKDKYGEFVDIYDENELKINIALSKSKIVPVSESYNALVEKYELLMTQLCGTSNQTIDDVYKQMCECESKSNQLRLDVEELSSKLKLYKNASLLCDKTEHELSDEIKKLQMQYKSTNNETLISINKKILLINKKLLKYGVVSNDMDTIMSMRAELNKELELINVDMNKMERNEQVSDCDCEYDVIPEKIASLRGLIKVAHIVPKKLKIDMTVHNKNVKLMDVISQQIDELVQETVTDDNIDMYINHIDVVSDKVTLPKVEFVKLKDTLLQPMKSILVNIKNNTTDDHRNKLSRLMKEKMLLSDMIMNGKNIIKENERISNLIKENKKINQHNESVVVQIEMYECHSNYLRLKMLSERKDVVVKMISSINDEYECVKLRKELCDCDNVLGNINHNMGLDVKIVECGELIDQIKYDECYVLQQNKLKEYDLLMDCLSKIKGEYEYLSIQKEREIVSNKLRDIKCNMVLQEEIELLSKRLEYECDRKKLVELLDKKEKLEGNVVIKSEISMLREEICKEGLLYAGYSKQQKVNIGRLSDLNGKVEMYNVSSKQLLEVKKEIELLEHERMNLKQYGELISPKKLQSKIIKKEILKLEQTMNILLTKYTKYHVSINFDGTGKNMDIIVMNGDGNNIRPNLLSAFENLILLTAFKCSIITHINSSRSKLYIMDESVENMDEKNFIETLPQLLNFVLSQYSYVLLVSQRDVKHISCHEIKIVKHDGVPMIL